MSLLSYTEIHELLESGVVEGADHSQVNPGSLNVTLGNDFLVEDQRFQETDYGTRERVGSRPVLCFSKRQSPTFIKHTGFVLLKPGAFCLASLREKINLPADLACDVMLRSSAARMGIQHLLAGYGDQGYSGHLTLELKNVLQDHSIKLREGDQIVQLRFHRTSPVPADKTYDKVSGKYSGDTGPQVIKAEHVR